jgi:gamma-glutamylcyclotransferase (GGCT)/AIG2-like uncharacterized protein YtfP
MGRIPLKPRAERKKSMASASLTHKLLFVYGTLKEGFPLNKGWLDGATLVRTGTIIDFAMISLGPYPALVKMPPAANIEDEYIVKGELWSVPNDVYNHVKQMEEGAGYTTVEAKMHDGTIANVFIFGDLQPGTYDWARAGKHYAVDFTPGDTIPF